MPRPHGLATRPPGRLDGSHHPTAGLTIWEGRMQWEHQATMCELFNKCFLPTSTSSVTLVTRTDSTRPV